MKLNGRNVKVAKAPTDTHDVCKLCVFWKYDCTQSGSVCLEKDFKDPNFDHYFVSDEKDN